MPGHDQARYGGRGSMQIALHACSLPRHSRQALLRILDGVLKLVNNLLSFEAQAVDDGLGVIVEAGEGQEDLLFAHRERREEAKVL